jgi:hypothetical protein
VHAIFDVIVSVIVHDFRIPQRSWGFVREFEAGVEMEDKIYEGKDDWRHRRAPTEDRSMQQFRRQTPPHPSLGSITRPIKKPEHLLARISFEPHGRNSYHSHQPSSISPAMSNLLNSLGDCLRLHTNLWCSSHLLFILDSGSIKHSLSTGELMAIGDLCRPAVQDGSFVGFESAVGNTREDKETGCFFLTSFGWHGGMLIRGGDGWRNVTDESGFVSERFLSLADDRYV